MPLFTRDIEQFTTVDRLPVLPLRDVVVFPYVVIPLLVGRPASLAALDAAEAVAGPGKDKFVLLVAQRSGETQDPAASDLYRIGVVGRVLQSSRLPNGTAKVLVEGIARARVTRYAPAGGWLRATVEPYPLSPVAGSDVRPSLPTAPGSDPGGGSPSSYSPDEGGAPRSVGRSSSRFEEYVSLHRRIPDETAAFVQAIESDERRAIAIAAHIAVKHDIRQKLLETPTARAICGRSLAQVLGAEIELLRLERKIDDDVRGSLFQNQREFYLQEQLRAISRELGQDEATISPSSRPRSRGAHLPDAVQARAQRELRKLRRTAPMSPETTVGRNYLDWLLGVPWSAADRRHSRRAARPPGARRGPLRPGRGQGSHSRLHRRPRRSSVVSMAPFSASSGRPGVGKTSLGRSIARALGRKFVRMALGGVRDEAEIRGHRRTYIGALPGRIIQAMRRAEVVNPVILLDEVDKLGQDYRGDPSAALLEVLDPEQNARSTTTTSRSTTTSRRCCSSRPPTPRTTCPTRSATGWRSSDLTGYLDHEKLAIARQFLIPKQLRRNGLAPGDVVWENDALPAILRQYTREAGVRELERRIARIGRKVARQRAESPAAIPRSPAGAAPPVACSPRQSPCEPRD